MGVLVLVQQGHLRLDEDVNEALTSWKIPDNEFTRRQAVTVRMLLNHTAGLDHSGSNAYAPLSMGDPFPSMVEILAGKPPAAAGPVNVISLPGSTFAYSAAGYEVLQQLVLDVSGEPFEQYMQTAVLEPIGMTDSTFSQDLSRAQLSQTATGYYAGGKPLPGRFRVGPALSVAGLWTTPTDIAKYIIDVQRSNTGQAEKPLTMRMTHEMLTPGLGSRGLGPAISGRGQTVRFGHDGFNEGFESSFIAYRRLGKGAVVMANSGFAFMLIKEVLGSISRVYEWPQYGATTQQPPSATIGQQLVISVPPAVLKAVPGQYAMDDIHITLFRRGQRLFVEWPTNGTVEVFATPDGRLFCPPLIFSEIGTPWLRLEEAVPGIVTGILAGDGERIKFRRNN
jgi:CubicO group peptidase (beta-lactamase class C family)